MDKQTILDMIAEGGVPYSQVRDSITAGDFMFLHDEPEYTLYGAQIAAVQAFTGPFAHVALIDKFGGRVWVEESVVPYVRLSPLSNVVPKGFFLLRLGIEMSEAERDIALKYVSLGEYSKPGAVAAGLNWINENSGDDDDGRWWCAKFSSIVRRGVVDCGPAYVPTAMADYMTKRYGKKLIYVRMD